MKTLVVHAWPGPAPSLQDGLFAILVDTSAARAPAEQPSPAALAAQRNSPRPSPVAPVPGAQRDAARLALRQAAREALAAVLGIAVESIAVVSKPGTPPSILLADRLHTIGCSFTHDDNYALAAINLYGPVGADIMRVQDVPDWKTVARDYLGPSTTAKLLAAADRPLAFTQAWTQREAALKCHAQQISEWRADIAGHAIELILPVDGLVGHLHIGDKHG